MRVTSAFSRLLCLEGVWVRGVEFLADRVVVCVALRRQRLVCPVCGYETMAREGVQDHESVWRHLDLGVWRLEIRATLRQLRCPEHGVHVEGVPFARHRARFTRDFDDLVAWLTMKADKTTITRLVRIDWQTIGRIIKRVGEELIDGDRLAGLFEISVDEVAWRKGHRYLTLVGDHSRGCVVWGCEGKGAAAADAFFDELDPPADDSTPTLSGRPSWEPEPAIMVPFGPCPTVAAGEGIPGGWLESGEQLEPQLFARASRLRAVSMDMTGGYAKSVRERAPQAEIVIDNYHVAQLATKALDEVRREHWNELRHAGQRDAAKTFKGDRWALLKNPDDLTDTQADALAEIQAIGGKVARAWTMKEMVRAIFAKGLTVETVSELIDRLLARLSRCRLEPFVRLGKTIRKHRSGILAARRLKLSNARAEALNNKAKLIVRRAYGFHSATAALALIHLTCGPFTLTLPHEK
ncbi:MAG: transposase [Steroidobacteraceae bacterium]